MNTETKDTSATGRHGADLALMRLAKEMRRRIRDRAPFVDALRETGQRMQADAVLLWMPSCRLLLPVAVQGTEVSVAVASEFESIAARISAMDQRLVQTVVFQGDDTREGRSAACRLLLVPVDTGSARFPAWLVFARELSSARFDTWAAVNAQVQGLRLGRRLMREFDPETGLLSRRGLRTALIGRNRRRGALLMADIDGLRTVNHTRGVNVGDMVIAALAQLLSPPLLPANAVVCRLSGAKFAVLLPDLETDGAHGIAVGLQQELARVEIKDLADSPRQTMSCGIAEYDLGGAGLNSALLDTDIVLRLAKERGRSRIETHQSNDASVIRRHGDDIAAAGLPELLRAGQIELYAQPIVSLRDRKHPPGFELLLRVRDAGESGDPARLVNVAQRYQMLPALDRHVVETALDTLAPHRELLARQRVTMGINVSGQSICDPEFATYFSKALKKSQVPPGCIVVEVTEQAAVSNLAQAAEVLRKLRALGCGIAIDDFGTGSNSLSYVHQLPVTRLKIDGGFVRDITTNRKSAAAIRSIVQLGRDFVVQTVGEYVESQEQAEALRKLGVDFGQGFLYGKPEPLESAVAKLLERESANGGDIVSVG